MSKTRRARWLTLVVGSLVGGSISLACNAILGIGDPLEVTSEAHDTGPPSEVADATPPSCSLGLEPCDFGTCVDPNEQTNCGGCHIHCEGAQVCSNKKCITPSVGCSDGRREAFVSQAAFPGIAGCAAGFKAHSLRDPKTGVVCGNNASVKCPAPGDACAGGWHVCGTPPYGPTDVSSRITATQCLEEPGGEFVAALGDQSCEPCSAAGAGAACCGSACIQQHGSCIYPKQTAWFGVISGHSDLCGLIQNDDPDNNGVLCCHD